MALASYQWLMMCLIGQPSFHGILAFPDGLTIMGM